MVACFKKQSHKAVAIETYAFQVLLKTLLRCFQFKVRLGLPVSEQVYCLPTLLNTIISH